MKARILSIILLSLISISFVKAQSYVFGFSYNRNVTFSKGSRTDYHMDNGEGGNMMVWSVQNGSAYGFDLSPIVDVDYRQQSYSVISVPGGGIANDVYELTKTNRTKPYFWNINFIFQWDQYAESIDRSVYIAYNVNDWTPDDYKDIWSRKTKEGQSQPIIKK